MEHYRTVIQRQIDLAKVFAVLSAAAVVVIPELLLFLILPTLISMITGDPPELSGGRVSPTIPVVIMAMPVIPLILVGMAVYQRAMMTAALYALLLNVDQNLEKLTKRA